LTRDRYNELGDFLLENTGDSPDSRKIEDKLDGTNKKWDDLLAALNERERALNDLAGPTNDFLNLTNKLQDNVCLISDDLDDVATSKADVEQKMAALQGISQNLDGQRPLLSDVIGLGEKLQDILTDPASKSEIKSKLGQVERQFNNCRKKLDNALAELENSAIEGKEFASACQDVQDMLREFEQLLSDKLAVSADKDGLKHNVLSKTTFIHSFSIPKICPPHSNFSSTCCWTTARQKLPYHWLIVKVFK
jgi:DNA repair exonuclease SbcCD ATPase subunit